MSRDRDERRERVSGRKRAETRKEGFDRTAVQIPEGVKLFKVDKEGTIRIDIVPYRVPKGAMNPYADDGQMYFERTYWTHYGIGPNESSYICPAKTQEKRCPICEHRSKLAKDPDTKPEELKAFAPKERQLWNVFDVDNPDKGVQIWDNSVHLFGKQLDARVKNADEDDDYEFFADPVDGSTIRAHFTEKKLPNSKYLEVDSIDFKPRKEPLDDDLLKQALVLDDLLIIEPYDRLKAIFLQEPDADKGKGSGGDRDEEPAKEKARDADDAPPPKRERRKEKEEEPRREEKPAKSSDAPGKPVYKKGDRVVHPDYGPCDVLKVNEDGTLTLTDTDDDVHKGVDPGEVRLKGEKKADAGSNGHKEEKPAKEEKREREPAKSEGKDDDWDNDWDK